jgi:putative Mg2+ transporter-C (MgtC) family protein
LVDAALDPLHTAGPTAKPRSAAFVLGWIGKVFDELALIAIRIAASLVVGAAIGFERGFHGRPAGFRTHALVCLASALLMLVTVFQSTWMTEIPTDAIRTDPTRMASLVPVSFSGKAIRFVV